MSTYKNPWINRTGKQKAIEEINAKLQKYLGRPMQPLDKLVDQLRRTVVKYFRTNPDKVKFFTDDWMNYDFSFEIEEKNDLVESVKIKF